MLMRVPEDYIKKSPPRLRFPPDTVPLGCPAILRFTVEFKDVSEPESVFTEEFEVSEGFLIGRIKNSQVSAFLGNDHWKNEEADLFFFGGDTAVTMLVFSGGGDQCPAIHYEVPDTMITRPIGHAALRLPPGEHKFCFRHRNSQNGDLQWRFKMTVRVVAESVP